MKWLLWKGLLLTLCLHPRITSGLALTTDRSSITSTTKPIPHGTFLKLVSAASRSHRPLHLRGRSVNLGSAEIKLNVTSLPTVHIIGPGSIHGSGHTLFTSSGNRRNSLLLDNLQLHHHSSHHRTQKRESGAAIWARGKSTISLTNCTITTQGGYGVWLVQKSRAHLHNCTVGPCGRSGMVLFGQAEGTVEQGIIQQCVRHGVCARGDTVTVIRDSVLRECGDRAVYAYHNATLCLEDSTIVVGGSSSSDDGRAQLLKKTSTVQVEALRSDVDRAHLRIRRCVLQKNSDVAIGMLGLSVAGNVECDLDGSVPVESSLSAHAQLLLPDN